MFFRPTGKPKLSPWSLIVRDIFNFSLQLLKKIQRNWTGSQISMSSSKFVFFRDNRKTKMSAWPLTGRDIFDFSFATAERNSTKLDRKQDFNILYRIYVFRTDQNTKLAPELPRHFRRLCNY